MVTPPGKLCHRRRLGIKISSVTILPPSFSTYFTKHVQTHNYPTRNAQDYSINMKKKMFSDRAIRNCGPSFWNYLDKTLKHCKTTKHFRNELKSVLLSVYNWFPFGACLVYLRLFVRCFSFKVSVYLMKPLLRVWLSQAFLAFKSCPQYHVVFLCLFVLMYDIEIKFDVMILIWYKTRVKRFIHKLMLYIIFHLKHFLLINHILFGKKYK